MGFLLLSEAVWLQMIIGVGTLAGLIVTSIFAYLNNKQSKVNSTKIEDGAVRQKVMLEKTEQIHQSTNGGLEKIRAEFREEIAGLKAELRESQAKSLSLAEASNPNQKSGE